MAPPSMDSEQMLSLFDSCWFDHQIITKKPPPPPSTTPPDLEIQKEPVKPEISRLPSLLVRSFSDQLSSQESFFSSEFSSPKSVLHPHKLQTIQSGKEVQEQGLEVQAEETMMKQRHPILPKKVTRRKRIGSTKSLSDLEFEELKGFMDMGFVFSEEDKNSELASIIPGLQRLGRRTEDGEGMEIEEKEEEQQHVVVSRPYLSEAWDVMEQERKPNPLMHWRIPSFSSENDVKDNLRCWAHTVASSIAIR